MEATGSTQTERGPEIRDNRRPQQSSTNTSLERGLLRSPLPLRFSFDLATFMPNYL